MKAAENFTISQAILADKNTAAAEIDRVLTDCITRARPVYLTLPTNLVFEKISSERLKIPLSRLPPPNDPEMEEFVLNEIVKLVEHAADDIVILVDACAIRHDVRDEVNELITRTGYPVYSAPMGKTAVSENYERYGGVRVSLYVLRLFIASIRYMSDPSVIPISKRRSNQRNSYSLSAALKVISILATSHIPFLLRAPLSSTRTTPKSNSRGSKDSG
jgi:TPP-dependent 2-oxoacid decarboxylase